VILAAGLTPAWQQIVVLDQLGVGQVNRAREVHWCASGKVINVGLALHHLGGTAKTLAFVGGDSGVAIQREFAQHGIAAQWVHSSNATRVCTTILEKQTGVATELVENAGCISEKELHRFQDCFAQEVRAAQFVVLIGSMPHGTPQTFYRDLLAVTPAQAVLDIRGDELLEALAEKPFLVKPNRAELAMTLRRDLENDAELLDAMGEVNRCGAEWVVISDGPNPVYVTSCESAWRVTPPRTEVVNPIGCGDCLAAGIAFGLERAWNVPDAVVFGLAAAANNAESLLPARLDAARIEQLQHSIVTEEL